MVSVQLHVSSLLPEINALSRQIAIMFVSQNFRLPIGAHRFLQLLFGLFLRFEFSLHLSANSCHRCIELDGIFLLTLNSSERRFSCGPGLGCQLISLRWYVHITIFFRFLWTCRRFGVIQATTRTSELRKLKTIIFNRFAVKVKVTSIYLKFGFGFLLFKKILNFIGRRHLSKRINEDSFLLRQQLT